MIATRIASQSLSIWRSVGKGRVCFVPSLFDVWCKRWDSPYINHFLQPDTIIPSPASPQSWNRYSYTGNNPIGYTDPTGHKRVEGCTELAGGCNVTRQTIDDDLKKENYFRQRTQHLRCKSGEKLYCADQSDAHLHSFSVSAGVGPWFVTASVDLVTTDDEWGLFGNIGLGPGLLNREKIKGSNLFLDYAGSEATGMTPQLGFTAWSGRLYGKPLAEDVKSYKGMAFQTGGSVSIFSAEAFWSASNDTKMIDSQITGEAFGIGASVQPAEVHANYSYAFFLLGGSR